MSADRSIVVARAFDPIEARLIVARLRSDGIPATTLWHDTLSNDWAMMLAFGGIAIAVPEALADDAVMVLAGMPPAPPLRRRWTVIAGWAAASILLMTLAPMPLRLRAELPSRTARVRP